MSDANVSAGSSLAWLSLPTSIFRDAYFMAIEPAERAAWFEGITASLELGEPDKQAYRGEEIFAASEKLSRREGIGNYRTRRWRRIKAARAIATHTEEEWQALLSVFGRRCLACGSVDDIQKDHVRAVADGGTDGIDNLQPLCRPCNSSKGAKFIDYRAA